MEIDMLIKVVCFFNTKLITPETSKRVWQLGWEQRGHNLG